MRRARLTFAALFVLSPFVASADFLTFDDLPTCGFPSSPCNPIIEGGYTFNLSGSEDPNFWHFGDGTFIDGTLNWHGTGGGFNSLLTLTLKQSDGGLFDLFELDVDVSCLDEIICGIFFGAYSILSVSAPEYGEVLFDASVDNFHLNFLGVSEVVFRHLIGPGVGIDNVLVRPAVRVPEPGTLVLFGIGLFGIGLGSRRRKLGTIKWTRSNLDQPFVVTA